MKLVKGTLLTGIFLSTLVLAASGLSGNPAQARPIPPWALRESNNPPVDRQINPSSPLRESNNPPIADSELAALKQQVYDQVNQYRATQGLPPLQLDSRISDQVQTYAQTMAEAGRLLEHQGLAQRAEVVRQAIPHTSYSYGENEYYCPCSATVAATVAVQEWLKSTDHHTNIVGAYELTGIGVAKDANGHYYFAQMFFHTQ